MGTTSREKALRLLYDDDLRHGKGTDHQQKCWQEIEWRLCQADPLYWFDHYAYITTKDDRIERWRLFPIQRMLISDWFEGYSCAAIKARQLGVTTLQVTYFLWRTLFKDAAKSFQVSDAEPKAIEALTKMAVTHDRLPQWMKERASRGVKLERNAKADKQDAAKHVKYGFSEMKVLTSTPNSVAGVSGTVALDEFPRHREQKRVMDNAIPAYEGGGQLILIGNGDGEEELFRTYYKAKRGEFPGMKSYFFSWKDDPRRVMGENAPIIDTDGNEIFPWYERTKLMFLRDNPEKDIYEFKRQYPSTEDEAFYITGDSFFDLRCVNGLSRLMHANQFKPKLGFIDFTGEKPRFHSNPNNPLLRMYNPPEDGEVYIIGVDPTGDGKDGDFAVAQVFRFLCGKEAFDRLEELGYTDPPIVEGQPAFTFEDMGFALEQVAVYQKRIEPVTFASQVERIGRFYNDAFTVIERNTHGGTVISHLKETYYNLYHEVRDEKFSDETTEMIGHYTSNRSKTEMYDLFRAWAMRGVIILKDASTIQEMARFGYDDRGRLSAPKGLHDDLPDGVALGCVGAHTLATKRTEAPDVNYGLDW